MSIANTLYNIFLKRSSTFFLTAMVGAFFLERTVDIGADSFWESHNKGKLFKDLQAKLEQQ